MDISAYTYDVLLDSVRTLSRDVAAVNASDVDRQSRFPEETLAALRRARLLSAPVPGQYGGSGCNMSQLSRICAALSHGCGASGMVLAMHYIQVACLARHSAGSELLRDYLRQLCQHQLLLASMTSEVGTYGDTRTSVCAVERDGDRFRLNKDATTGSYCAHADGILVTARKDKDAASNDQVLVLVRSSDYRLSQTSSWDTLGMRGTCSPGFRLESTGPLAHIFPDSYGDVSASTMVPYSHILWSALWWGIASDAYGKAAAFVRAQARKNPGVVPPTAIHLAQLSAKLQTMRNNWSSLAAEFDEMNARPDAFTLLSSIGWNLKMNNLKTVSSELAPIIVHEALQIIGILAYKNDSPYSLGRHYRDVLSASLMISNERIAAKSASMLLVFKDE
jgi:acyl-CoA dehydrogenase